MQSIGRNNIDQQDSTNICRRSGERCRARKSFRQAEGKNDGIMKDKKNQEQCGDWKERMKRLLAI